MQTPDFNSAAAVVHVVGPRPETMSEALAQLKKFVLRSIVDTNLLGLSDADVQATAELILQAKEKSEIFNWANTLMLPETFAAEVVKRREDIAKLGIRTDDDNVSSVSLATTAASRKTTKSQKGGAARGKAVNLAAAHASDSTGGLIEGQLFECGCFATKHTHRSNCVNCGRIICMQESDDSCYSCGMDPSVCMAYELKLQQGAIDAAADAKNRAAYEKAVKQRDTLMQYARERSKRTIVVDDQTGMYASGGFATAGEREASAAAEEERRRKVADLHKASGAYTVHLDIVKQSVCLGATALLKKTEDILQHQITDAEAAAKYGLSAASDEAADSRPMRAGDAVHAAARLADAARGDADADEDADASDDDTPGRVAPLPALVERIFYKGASADKAHAATGAPAAGPSLVRRIAESRRVQTDYYEDDKISWRIARQQQRLGDVGAGDEAAGAQDEDEERIARGGLRRPIVDPSTWADNTTVDDEPDCRAAPCQRAAPAPSPAVATAGPAAGDPAAIWKRLRHKDDGMCLSMHQPWASLLIAGIKTHEGRSWPSDWRGRLWIHAAAAKPSHTEEIEAQYVRFLAPGQTFPTDYPTSCLLGYVVVTDNVDKATYEATFTPEERQESSDFKFICCGATPLPFPLAMDGKHKVFKLEKKLWLAARKQLNEQAPGQR